MGLVLGQLGAVERGLVVFDSFEGLAAPTAADPDCEIAKAPTGTCLGTLEDVSPSFRRLGILDRASLIKGWFSDTLPTTSVGEDAVLRVDGDWYESVKSCLDDLCDKGSPGGIIQLDDCGLGKGARKAVDESFAARAIRPRFERLDCTGRQFLERR
jgi:hypothetical protein